MMPWRGEFRFANGLILPNNLTDYGAQEMLKMSLWGSDSVLVAPAGSFDVGLCTGLPSLTAQIEDLTEPTIGVNGYARIAVTRDTTGWPNSGTVNGQFYTETGDLVWTASGGDFDQSIQRLFFSNQLSLTTGDFLALSAAMPNPVTIGTATLAADRTFRYRVYSR